MAQQTRWVAYPGPHVLFQFYDALTGELRCAEAIHARYVSANQ